MPERTIIHIYGASGSGTTTIGNALAQRYGFRQMDTDDYFWLPTDPPFCRKREREQRLLLMRRELEQGGKIVITGSLCGWGDPLTEYFDLAVRVETPAEVRLQRIRQRESLRFGDRIREGGDMAQAHQAFLAWAVAYDTGDESMRSLKLHRLWEKTLPCPHITVSGEQPAEKSAEEILRYLHDDAAAES